MWNWLLHALYFLPFFWIQTKAICWCGHLLLYFLLAQEMTLLDAFAGEEVRNEVFPYVNNIILAGHYFHAMAPLSVCFQTVFALINWASASSPNYSFLVFIFKGMMVKIWTVFLKTLRGAPRCWWIAGACRLSLMRIKRRVTQCHMK